jgi:hypothetical protein
MQFLTADYADVADKTIGEIRVIRGQNPARRPAPKRVKRRLEPRRFIAPGTTKKAPLGERR